MAIGVKANNASRAKNRVYGIILALIVIVFVCVLTAISAAETKKVVTVCRIKQDAPISANSLITEDMLEAYDMYYKEFEQYGTMEFSDGKKRSIIVRWSDKENIVGKRYAAYYMRGGTVLFWDSTLKEQTKKNSYLYSMSGELLNIQMTTTSDFGDMVGPGDSLNIRASYIKTDYTLPTEEQYKLSMNDPNSDAENAAEYPVEEPLFSEVQILDMLNSEGSSIFDIYYDYISKTKSQQAALLADDSFLSSVKPSSILLECTAEEVEHYIELQSKGASYQMTLLPRTSSSSIVDSLSDIQTALAGLSSSDSSNSNK